MMARGDGGSRLRTWLELALRSESQLSPATSWLLLSPMSLLYLFAFIIPVFGIARLSFFDPEFTLENYDLLITESLFISVLWRTVWISALVTLVSLLVGYPLAFVLAKSRGRIALLGLACVLIPLWLSILVRSYSWVVILARNGVLSTALRDIGLLHPDSRLIFNDFAVVVAMVHVLLPFMILPLFSALRGIPDQYVDAALSSGARPVRAFFDVTLPLSLPGVFSGCVLVFVVSLGFFVTPQLVGGPNSMMASMLITREATYGNNWGLASAISVVLLVFSMTVVAVFGRYTNRGEDQR